MRSLAHGGTVWSGAGGRVGRGRRRAGPDTPVCGDERDAVRPPTRHDRVIRRRRRQSRRRGQGHLQRSRAVGDHRRLRGPRRGHPRASAGRNGRGHPGSRAEGTLAADGHRGRRCAARPPWLPRAHPTRHHVVHAAVGRRDPETSESEPNDEPSQSTLVPTPTTINGWLGVLEDVDVFRIHAKAGQDLVARITATPIGSSADAVVTFLDAAGRLADQRRLRDDARLARGLPAACRHRGHREGHRRQSERRPPSLPSDTRRCPRRDLCLPAWPSRGRRGRRAGRWRQSEGASSAAVGPPMRDRPTQAPVIVNGLDREPVTRPEVALGTYREVREIEGNNTLATAQPLSAPVTVNGRISRPPAGAPTPTCFA